MLRTTKLFLPSAKMEKNMNIIVVGCGNVGKKIVEMLCLEKEHNVTVVDTRSVAINAIVNQHDVMGVIGSGTSVDALTDAGVKNADILIAVTTSDEINLLTCLVARKIGKCQTIARVRNPEYNKEVSLFTKDFGLSMIINPERAAAAVIARNLRFPAAISIDTFSKGRAEILKFRISDNSTLDNSRVADIVGKLNCDVLVCGVERNDEAIIPHGDFVLKSGDYISVLMSLKTETKFFKKAGIKSGKVSDTMIIGGGETAVYLASLLQQSGINVKILEKDSNRCDELCNLLPKATIINADGTDNKQLLEEGLANASSFVSLTNIDEENILLSMFAKTITNGKLITKINRIAYDDVINGLDLGTTICPKNITAEYIVQFVRAKKNSMGSNIETMHRILNGKAEALEFRIRENSPIANIALQNLSINKNAIIACINRNGNIIIPRGNDVMMPNDTVIVVTTALGHKDISEILKRGKFE